MASHCPFCDTETLPIANQHDPDRPHRLRNPLQCPECGGYGGHEDWVFLPEGRLTSDEVLQLFEDLREFPADLRGPSSVESLAFDVLSDRVGPIAASRIWSEACQLFDRKYAPEEFSRA
jgi:hypothetical protein